MKFYHNLPSRKAREFLRRFDMDELRWAMSVKPGDLINGCTTYPFNTVVSEVHVFRDNPWNVGDPFCAKQSSDIKGPWRTLSGRGHSFPSFGKGWVVTGVGYTTTDGHSHRYPGGGCVEPPLSPDEIRNRLTHDVDGVPLKEEDELAHNTRFYTDWPRGDGSTVQENVDRAMDLFRRARDGKSICDERGLRLPS